MKKFITFLLILILCVGAIGAVWYFSGGFGGATPTALVQYDGKSYVQFADIGQVRSGAEFRVYAIGEYEIRIEAREGTEFTFTVGEEGYSWSDLAGKDMTDCFEIQRKNGGFSLIYPAVENILSGYFGTAVSVPETESEPVFDLIIKTSENELRLSFSISEPVTSITIDPDHFLF